MFRIVCLVLVSTAAVVPARAEPGDLAELFPPDTLAYAEVRNPADAARVVAGWVKGTPLDDGLRFVHDRRDAIKDHRQVAGQLPVGIVNLLTSPEFLREVGRFRGAAVALTGFTDKHEPQAAVAVLFGDSAAGGLLARGFLTTERDLRRVDTLDRVPIFQHRSFPPPAFGNDGKPLPLENAKPTEGGYEATYAYTPGLFVVGTNKVAVGDVLKRFAGPPGRPSLAEDATFTRFAGDRKKPGVFFYANPPVFVAKHDAVRKAGRDVIDADTIAALKFVANAKALPAVAGNLTLGDDEVALTLRADAAPGQPSSLLGLLAGSAGPRLLAPTPADAAGAIALALPGPADRANAVLAFADACAKAAGEIGPLPSERFAEAEKRIGLSVRSDLLRRLTAVTVVIPERQELPKGAPVLPVLVAHSDDDHAAAAIAAAVPKLVGLASGSEKVPDASAETIQGVRVLSLPAVEAAGVPAIHYAHAGARVVLGLDRKWVARIAAWGGKSFADTLPASDRGGSIVGGFRLGSLVRLSNQYSTPPATRVNARAGPAAVGTPADRPVGGSAALAGLLDTLPQLTIRIEAGKWGLSAAASVRGFRANLPTTVGKLVLWLEHVGMESVPNDGANIPPLHLK